MPRMNIVATMKKPAAIATCQRITMRCRPTRGRMPVAPAASALRMSTVRASWIAGSRPNTASASSVATPATVDGVAVQRRPNRQRHRRPASARSRSRSSSSPTRPGTSRTTPPRRRRRAAGFRRTAPRSAARATRPSPCAPPARPAARCRAPAPGSRGWCTPRRAPGRRARRWSGRSGAASCLRRGGSRRTTVADQARSLRSAARDGRCVTEIRDRARAPIVAIPPTPAPR